MTILSKASDAIFLTCQVPGLLTVGHELGNTFITMDRNITCVMGCLSKKTNPFRGEDRIS